MSPAESTLVKRFPRDEKYGRNYIKTAAKPGVLAFRNDKAGWMPKVRRETMRVGAKTFALVSWCGGEWEVYRIESDGYTETFLGYMRDIVVKLAKGEVR